MTQFFSAVLVLLSSTAAFAYPAIGDYAMWKGTSVRNGMSSNISLERSITGFDASMDMFSVVETVSVDGQVQTSTIAQKSDELLTKQQVGEVLSFCAMAGGVLEGVTVPAGSFATCKLPTTNENGQSDGFIWVGDVSFGIVKASGVQDGADYVLELSTFRAGN